MKGPGYRPDTLTLFIILKTTIARYHNLNIVPGNRYSGVTNMYITPPCNLSGLKKGLSATLKIKENWGQAILSITASGTGLTTTIEKAETDTKSISIRRNSCEADESGGRRAARALPASLPS